MKSFVTFILILFSLSLFPSIIHATDATPSATPTNSPPICLGISANPGAGSKPLTVNFSCAGYDSNSDITASEFGFGGDQKRIVEKNIGQYGSITTSFTYTTPGTYNVTCRMRDNNNSFSSYPSYCTYSVIVSDNVLTPTPIRTPIPTQPAPTIEIPTLAPSPTLVILPTIISPTPTLQPSLFANDKIKQLITMLAVSSVTIIIALSLHAFFDKR